MALIALAQKVALCLSAGLQHFKVGEGGGYLEPLPILFVFSPIPLFRPLFPSRSRPICQHPDPACSASLPPTTLGPLSYHSSLLAGRGEAAAALNAYHDAIIHYE